MTNSPHTMSKTSTNHENDTLTGGAHYNEKPSKLRGEKCIVYWDKGEKLAPNKTRRNWGTKGKLAPNKQ